MDRRRKQPGQKTKELKFGATVPDGDAHFRGSHRASLMGSPQGQAVLSSRYNLAIQDSRMTIGYFVETKFIPEHVQYKTRAGQTHFQAIMKHILRPETVDRIFVTDRSSTTRLRSVPDWPYLDDVMLCDFNADYVRKILSLASNRNYSWQTIKHIKNVMGAIISHAQQEGCFWVRNPVSQVKLPPKPRKSEDDLTIWQAKMILEHLCSPEKEIAQLRIYTGMNVLEICNLQWKHVNLSDSPRNEDGELIPPKSIAVGAQLKITGVTDYARTRRREIAITWPVLLLLRSIRAGNKNSHPNDFVFTTSAGDAISPVNVRRSLRPIGRRLNIPWLSWKSLSRVRIAARRESLENLGALLDFSVPAEQPDESLSIEATSGTEDLLNGAAAELRESPHRTFCVGLRVR